MCDDKLVFRLSIKIQYLITFNHLLHLTFDCNNQFIETFSADVLKNSLQRNGVYLLMVDDMLIADYANF